MDALLLLGVDKDAIIYALKNVIILIDILKLIRALGILSLLSGGLISLNAFIRDGVGQIGLVAGHKILDLFEGPPLDL